MPAPPNAPDVGLFTRYVLENPYPLTIVLIVLAAALAWMGLREGRTGPLKAAVACAIAGAAVFMTSMVVTTSGQHGETVTRNFVNAVVDGDLPKAMSYMSPNASLAVGSPQNPGRNVDFMRSRLADLHARYPIQSNRITSLRGYSEGADRAVVHLSCRTAAGGFGATPSQWVLHVQRDGDGQWLITQLTAISIGAQVPGERLW